jgi:hypothetical protein
MKPTLPTLPTPQEWLEYHAERMREKTLEAWHEWAVNAKIGDSVLQWVKDNPDALGVESTDDANPYIYSPPVGKLKT